MHQPNGFDHGPSLFQLIEQALELMRGHGVKCLVLDARDFLRRFSAANESAECEGGTNAGGGIACGDECRFIDGFRPDMKKTFHGVTIAQPPCTGGNKETSAPSDRTNDPS